MKTILIMAGGAAVMMASYLVKSLGENVRALCIAPGGVVDPLVSHVLHEDGISPVEPSTLVDIHMGVPFDLVVTLNGEGQRTSSGLGCTHRVHCPIKDPDPADPVREHYRLRNEVKFFSELIVGRLKGRLT